jgi:hypothetical protein
MAFAVVYHVTGEDVSFASPVHVDLHLGPIVFLPEIDLPSDETILLVLRSICGLQAPEDEPEWANNLIAPGQARIDEQINQIGEGIRALEARSTEAEAARAVARLPIRLLYDHDDSLVEVTWDIFRGLGAEVIVPDERGKEDGFILVRIGDVEHRGALEVKSTRRATFDEDGLRQLEEWKTRGGLRFGVVPKGIFIGNSAYYKDPNQREFPFADNWVRNARMFGHCAMTTTLLYDAYVYINEGRLTTNDFWGLVFATNGILNQQALSEVATPPAPS